MQYGRPPRGYNIVMDEREIYVYTGYSTWQRPIGDNYFKIYYINNSSNVSEIVRIDIRQDN